jgi:hypothetical protein
VNARAFPRPKPRLVPTTTVVLPDTSLFLYVSLVFVPYLFPARSPDAGNDGRPERAGARSGEVGGASFRMRHWRSYSSWWRYQSPVSLRPRGARSSHWYMPQRASSPRAYAE